MRDLQLIYSIVCDYFLLDLSTQSRKRCYVDGRNLFYKLSRELLNVSYPTIANLVNKNHATIIHGIRTVDFLITYDEVTKNNYLTLKNKCIKKVQNLANPYEKYLGKEDILQHQVMKYLETKYPKVYAIHVPNEGKRSTFERFKFKYLGGKPGVPDILIFRAGGKEKYGLAIELKIGYNKPTENQFKALNDLKRENWEVHWSNDYEKTISIIDEYLS